MIDYDGILNMMNPEDLPKDSFLREIAEETPEGFNSVKDLLRNWDGFQVSVPKLNTKCVELMKRYVRQCAANGDSIYKIVKKSGRPMDVVKGWLKD